MSFVVGQFVDGGRKAVIWMKRAFGISRVKSSSFWCEEVSPLCKNVQLIPLKTKTKVSMLSRVGIVPPSLLIS